VTLLVVVLLCWVAAALVARVFRYRPRPRPVMRPSTRRRIRADAPHVLYHYPHALRPGRRYIGISNEPRVRHRRHSAPNSESAWWFRTSTGVMVIDGRYPNRRAAQLAERAAILDACRNGEDIANAQGVPAWHRNRMNRETA
jgi:hypothetical protein